MPKSSPALALTTETLTEVSSDMEILLFSQLLKACGDPLRIQILQVLKADTFGVLELTQLFETKQSGMSHHLKVLSKVGLVEAQREGNAIFYRRPFNLSGEYDEQATAQLFELIDRFALPLELQQRMAVIRDQRAEQSQAFFERNAERFAEQQELICDHSQYADACFDLLLKSALPETATVLELGPGEGLFLKPLSRQFDQVIALDNSSRMLDKARSFAKREQLHNVRFELGDSGHFRSLNEQVDAVAMNMVLHHVPTPAQIFEDCYTFLRPGGVMVVCDLAHHNQEWARKNCGDLWLGFEHQELDSWAQRAGFVEDENVYIGLRNGFQIQLRKYLKPLNSPKS